MAKYHEMTLVDRQRVARDTMAFWLDAKGTGFEFRAGQHADFVLTNRVLEVKTTIRELSPSPALLKKKGQS
jgi:ferredoxin-NADP reductase